MHNEEYHIQVALVTWLQVQYPNVLFTISPAGMKLSIGQAVKMKRMGYRPGTADLLFFEPRKGFHGLFIELKTPTGKVDKKGKQEIFLREANKRGYLSVVAYGYSDAVEKINHYFAAGVASQGR